MKLLKNDDIETVKKLKKYLKKYYIIIIANILLAMVSSAVTVSPAGFIKRFIDKGIIGKNEKDILYAAGTMIMLAVVSGFLVYWNTVLAGKISSSIYKDIVDDIYQSAVTGYGIFFKNKSRRVNGKGIK